MCPERRKDGITLPYLLNKSITDCTCLSKSASCGIIKQSKRFVKNIAFNVIFDIKAFVNSFKPARQGFGVEAYIFVNSIVKSIADRTSLIV